VGSARHWRRMGNPFAPFEVAGGGDGLTANLRWHEAGNGGYSQGEPADTEPVLDPTTLQGPPRPMVLAGQSLPAKPAPDRGNKIDTSLTVSVRMNPVYSPFTSTRSPGPPHLSPPLPPSDASPRRAGGERSKTIL